MRTRCVLGLSLAAMLAVASLGATGNDAPLAEAVQRRDTQTVRPLLKKRADVNAPQSDGATALHWAVYLEDPQTTALLIRAGAKVDIPNNYGVTPLALAAGNGNAAIIKSLLNSGAVQTARCVPGRRRRCLRRARQTPKRSARCWAPGQRSTRRRRGTDKRR